mmetsp:Transcript_47027/g.102371  ORF Transcript_47027/g.102371 Transcript_47027/m.102371 type:complete len:179 (-) Transcript_47027:474-1010(-)
MTDRQESVEQQPQATLCSKGCGFFANVSTGGLCSKCYREAETQQQKLDEVAQKAVAAVSRGPPVEEQPEAVPMEVVPTPAPAPVPVQPPAAASASTAAAPETTPDAPAPPPCNPNRCNVSSCRKKLGLTGFKCRCGYSFCGTHRYAESHECQFDYKTFERRKIADSNPLVQGSKIQKI